jgi:hypothetical protein
MKNTRKRPAPTAQPAVSEPPVLPVEPAPEMSASEDGAVARLAYSYWEARGCEGGSPEEDWFRAEQELRSRK